MHTSHPRIAFVTPYYHPVAGGITTFVSGLADAMEDRGAEVTILAREGNPKEGVRVGPSSPRSFVRWCRGELAATRPEVVHAHSHWYCLAGALGPYGRRRWNRVIFTFHTMPELRGSRLNAFERLLRKADILTFVSRHEMENFRRRYRIPVRLEVVYPGVSIAPFPVAPPASEANGFRLCVVSMMSWHQKVRGLELLLEAVSRLRREIPTISLVVIGDGEYRGHLEALAARLGLSDCVRFEGRVDDPRPEVARADLLCHISFKESFGLVVLEALSLGIPVLLNDEIVIDDALPDGPSGVIRCPSNVDGICQAIRHLAARRQDLRALGATGRAYVTERFSWDRQAEVFSRLYGLSSGSGP